MLLSSRAAIRLSSIRYKFINTFVVVVCSSVVLGCCVVVVVAAAAVARDAVRIPVGFSKRHR